MKHLLFVLLASNFIQAGAQVIQITGSKEDPVGKHYQFPDFVDGQIIMVDGDTVSTLLNYNYITEEMIVDLGHTKTPYQDAGKLKSILLDGTSFLIIDDVIYEVLVNDVVSLLVHRKQVIGRAGQNTGLGRTSATSSTELPPAFYDKKILYELEIPGEYILTPSKFFFLKKGNDLIPLRSTKKIGEFFPNLNADELKNYLKRERPKIDREDDLVKLITFCNKS